MNLTTGDLKIFGRVQRALRIHGLVYCKRMYEIWSHADYQHGNKIHSITELEYHQADSAEESDTITLYCEDKYDDRPAYSFPIDLFVHPEKFDEFIAQQIVSKTRLEEERLREAEEKKRLIAESIEARDRFEYERLKKKFGD